MRWGEWKVVFNIAGFDMIEIFCFFWLNCDILQWTTHGEQKEGPWFLMFLHKIFELHIPKPDDLEFVKVHSVVDKGIRNTERNIKNIIFFKIKGVIR